MSKSLQDFTAWAVGTRVVANPNGTYPGQCVSLVQQYLNQVFGIPYAPRGNAKDFVPPTFVRVSSYRPGDIVRYGSNYGSGYSHIGYIDHNGVFTDQNGVKKLAVGQRSTPFSGINAIFRPTKPFTVKNPVPTGGTATCHKAAANVRALPNTSSKITSVLHNGDTFQYTGKVVGQSVGGNNIWYHSKLGHYVHSSGISG